MTALRGARVSADDDAPVRPNRRRRRTALLVAGALVLVAFGTWLVAFSPVLGVRTVTVHGTHLLTADEVERAADITHGAPLVRLDTAAIAARIDRLPLVESARVTTSLPSTVSITVVERTPVGWLQAGSDYLLVDHTGARYRAVTERPNALPHLVLPQGADRATTAAVAEVAAVLPRDLLPRISSIQALDPTAITLVTRSHRVVHWGSSARSADKARILPVLLGTHATTVDVSNPAAPFTR